LRSHRLDDLFSRVLPAAFFLLAVGLKIQGLITFVVHSAGTGEASSALSFYVSVGSRISVILFLGLMATLFMVRERAVKKADGLSPRIMAILGTFMMSVLTFFPRAELGIIQTLTATIIVLTGTFLSTIVLLRLGRSFSLMAEARKLVTTGPYALVRHPLYLAEEIAVIGTLLQFFSFYTLLVFVVHLWIQIQRMKNEEAVLREAFPGYVEYQARTFRLIPRIY
jgi:protein-S-isoprenylcysteine O-methyltransferase Ste14